MEIAAAVSNTAAWGRASRDIPNFMFQLSPFEKIRSDTLLNAEQIHEVPGIIKWRRHRSPVPRAGLSCFINTAASAR
jgi:hypothetical protein